MKFIKRLIIGVLILIVAVVITSVETDFFANIEEYIPGVEEKAPFIKDAAEWIEEITEPIPSISQIIATLQNKSLPVDPEDFVAGSYNSLSPMLNFYSDETVGVLINGADELSVFGISKETKKSNILIIITDASGEEVVRESVTSNVNFEFQKKIKIPKTESDTLNVNIYTGEKGYGEFTSWVIDYVILEKNDDVWKIKKSPVWEHNKLKYEEGKLLSEGLKATSDIRPDNPSVKSIADQLTKDVENDYEKLLILHDWITGYLYYNIDYVNDSKTAPYVDTEVLKSRKVVCLGYSNLFASLCRSINIPCYVVSGYALGIDSADKVWNDDNYLIEEPNHAWNEAYVNGRWIIIDTTWDSFNRYENGEMKKSENRSHLYFDANPEFFSQNHKIIEYLTH